MISKSNLEKMATMLGGTMILGVVQGTPCAEAGMRYGDILLVANGQPIPNWQAYVDAKALREDGMDLTYYRDGKEISISITYSKEEVSASALIHELASMHLV